MKYFFAWIPFLFLAACVAPQTRTADIDPGLEANEAELQRQLLAEDYVKQYGRILDVYYPISKGAKDFCLDYQHKKYGENAKLSDSKRLTVFEPGAYFVTEKSFSEKELPSFRKIIPIDDGITVLLVAKNSPTDRAGIKRGDQVLEINHQPIKKGKDIAEDFNKQLTAATALSPTVNFTVLRQGQTITTDVVTEEICNYAINYKAQSKEINAYADGTSINVERGLLKIIDNDDELALVLGHELAHNAMGHMDAKMTNQMAGGVLGTVIDVLAASQGVSTNFGNIGAGIGGSAYSQSFESEADYVGLLILARAGFNYHDAPVFWRKMAIENPGSISYATSHPTSAKRLLQLEEVSREIDAKKAAGQPLVPNFNTEG